MSSDDSQSDRPFAREDEYRHLTSAALRAKRDQIISARRASEALEQEKEGARRERLHESLAAEALERFVVQVRTKFRRGIAALPMRLDQAASEGRSDIYLELWRGKQPEIPGLPDFDSIVGLVSAHEEEKSSNDLGEWFWMLLYRLVTNDLERERAARKQKERVTERVQAILGEMPEYQQFMTFCDRMNYRVSFGLSRDGKWESDPFVIDIRIGF